MALPKFEVDVRIISKLDDEPNDVGGLSAEEFKGKFDEASELIKQYINETLIPRIESDIEAAAKGIGGGGTITGEMLSDGSVAGAKLANGAVTNAKIEDGAVSTAKLADKAITGAKVADKTIGSTHIEDGSIYREKIADEAISADKIFPGAVVSSKLAAKVVSSEKIADELKTLSVVKVVSPDWSGSVAPYTKSVAVSGMLSTDRPKVFFSAPDSFANVEAQQEAFAMLYDVDSANGSITLHAKEKPGVEFSVLVEVSRI